jgi:ElaB/YqjD/DUF883 family membrane-anchored ribosome-binding protein
MTSVTREDLVSDVKGALNDVETMLQQAATASGPQAQELRERAAGALRATQAKLREIQAAARESAKAAAKSSNDWVHANPWTAVGVAAGVGVVVGLLIGRR